MPHLSDYTVKLDAFEGPMDLLLFLIRRAEVEIADIPISTITEQYIAYLREGGVHAIDIDKAGEFLVMAATLMEIKSRFLVPRQSAPGEGEPDAGSSSPGDPIDPRADLIRQLLAYKKYRDAAGQLHDRLEEWENRFPAGRAAYDTQRVHEVITEMADVDMEDIELVDLVSAFARVVESVDLTRVGEHHVVVDDTPIELHAEDILDRLRRDPADPAQPSRAREVEFASIFSSRTRGEMIGLFLAMLELVRQRRIGVRQEPQSSTIVLFLRSDTQDASSIEPVAPAPAAAE